MCRVDRVNVSVIERVELLKSLSEGIYIDRNVKMVGLLKPITNRMVPERATT